MEHFGGEKFGSDWGERWGIKREERQGREDRLEWMNTEGLFERDRRGGQVERWWMEAGEGGTLSLIDTVLPLPRMASIPQGFGRGILPTPGILGSLRIKYVGISWPSISPHGRNYPSNEEEQRCRA